MSLKPPATIDIHIEKSKKEKGSNLDLKEYVCMLEFFFFNNCESELCPTSTTLAVLRPKTSKLL